MIEIIPNWHPIWVHFAVALLSAHERLENEQRMDEMEGPDRTV